MSSQASRESFRVRGENAPVWLPSGLALLGLGGSIVTALLLLPNWYGALHPAPPGIETSVRATPAPPPGAGEELGEMPQASDSAEEANATVAPVDDRVPAVTDAMQAAEQVPASADTATEPPLPDAVVGRLDPVDSSTGSGTDTPASRPLHAGDEQASLQQIGPDAAREPDDETMSAGTPYGARPGIEGSTINARVQAGPESSDHQHEGAMAHEEEVPSTDTSSEPQVTPTPSSDTRIDAGSTKNGAAQSEAAASLESSSGTADPAGDQVSFEVGGASTTEQKDPVQEPQGNTVEADSEGTVDESVGDCAPVFSVGFPHGSIEPNDKDIKRKIKRLAHWLNAHPRAIIFADGHADSSGPEEVNLVLSYRRAAAIADRLSNAGAPKAKIIIRAYGEGASLVPSTESEPGRRVTLRTEIGLPCEQQASENGGPQ